MSCGRQGMRVSCASIWGTEPRLRGEQCRGKWGCARGWGEAGEHEEMVPEGCECSSAQDLGAQGKGWHPLREMGSL